MWFLILFAAFAQFTGCGDDPLQPATTVDIAIGKSVDNESPTEGSVAVYTVVASNGGPLAASAVAVTDTLPAGVTYQFSNATQGAYDPLTGVWDVGNLGVNASATLTLSVTLDLGTGGMLITNEASLSSVAEVDTDGSNDVDTAELNSQFIRNVDISVTKTVDNDTPTEGGSIVYTVVAANLGPDSASVVELTDVLPPDLTYQSASATQGTYDPGTGVWDVGGIGVAESETLTLTVTVDEGTGGKMIVNQAMLTAVAENDTDSTNDSDTADIQSQDHVFIATPIKDNTLYQDAGGNVSNGVGEFMFSGRTMGATIRRCLLAFDLSTLPANAIIENVDVTLTVSKAATDNAVNFVMHRVLANWGEGTSNAGGRSPVNGGGGGDTSTTGDATWVHTFFPNSFWNNQGGDFRSFEGATVAVGPPGEYTWTGNGLRDDVLHWMQNPTQNFGWMLIGNELANQTAKRFDTRENVDGTGPQLVVTYALPKPREKTSHPITSLPEVPQRTVPRDGGFFVVSDDEVR